MTENIIDFEAAVRFSPVGIILTDNNQSDCRVIFVNEAFTSITGYTFQEAVGRNCRFLQGPMTSQASVSVVREALAAGAPVKVKMLNYRKNGEPFWNELRINPRIDARGEVIGFIGIQTDVSATHKLQEESAEMRSRLDSIVENMPGYVFQRSLSTNGSLGMTYVSPSLTTILGIAPGGAAGANAIFDYIHPDDNVAIRDRIAQSATGMRPVTLEFRLKTQQGAIRWIRSYSAPRRTVSGETVWDGVGLDVTAEKVAEDRLTYLAYHDPLTGMANRDLFALALLKDLHASAGRLILLMIDLDAFEEINDAVGRSSADSVLRAVAKRVTDFAELHAGFAARIGGDEFAVVFPSSSTDEDETRDVAGTLCRNLAVPYRLAGVEHVAEASVGAMAFSLERACEDLEAPAALAEMMKRAGLALQAAKRAGRGMYRVYTAAEDNRQKNQTILRQSMKTGIADNQFALHYHPQVDLTSGRIVGAEALVRWNHPELGFQSPDLFIPFAETSGLIVSLGIWIFREAMRQVKAWQMSGIVVPKLAINMSGVQLRDPGLLRSLEAALSETGTEASQFDLELTESFVIEAASATLDTLRALKSMGFTLSVDDFGTGHSSFRYLRDFPVDKLKIDQSFVRQMVIDSSDASIIRAIIALARTLDLGVVAEGIETSVQRDFLREEGCRIGQGYLFSLPLAPEDFAYLIDQDIRLPMTDAPVFGNQKAASR